MLTRLLELGSSNPFSASKNTSSDWVRQHCGRGLHNEIVYSLFCNAANSVKLIVDKNSTNPQEELLKLKDVINPGTLEPIVRKELEVGMQFFFKSIEPSPDDEVRITILISWEHPEGGHDVRCPLLWLRCLSTSLAFTNAGSLTLTPTTCCCRLGAILLSPHCC